MTDRHPNPARQPGTPEWLAANWRDYWTGPRHFYLDNPELADPEPTAAPPGSREKLAILCQRADAGQDLWHPDDGPPFDD